MAKEKTFYSVVSSYFDDGRVIAHIDGSVQAAEKPRGTFYSGRDRDVYHDFFSSLQEAEDFVKQAKERQFVIVDAGMTELLRPALYGAKHKVQNISSLSAPQTYDVVGPICESSDIFAKDCLLPETKRGDLIAIRSAGAYGETMASQYNCRELPKAYTSE